MTVTPLTEHPVHQQMNEYYDRVRESGSIGKDKPDQFYLGVQIRYLLQLDPTAVYRMVGGSTVVYYDSEYGRKAEGIGRIVLSPEGKTLRIETVHIDPRGSVASPATPAPDEERRLTKDEFREHLENYFSWATREPQSLMSWLTSLEDWTKVEWNREYAKRSAR